MSDNSLDFKKFYEEINGWKEFLSARRKPKNDRFLPFLNPSEKMKYFAYVMKKYEVMQYELDHPLLSEEEKSENYEIGKRVQEIQNSYLS